MLFLIFVTHFAFGKMHKRFVSLIDFWFYQQSFEKNTMINTDLMHTTLHFGFVAEAMAKLMKFVDACDYSFFTQANLCSELTVCILHQSSIE